MTMFYHAGPRDFQFIETEYETGRFDGTWGAGGPVDPSSSLWENCYVIQNERGLLLWMVCKTLVILHSRRCVTFIQRLDEHVLAPAGSIAAFLLSEPGKFWTAPALAPGKTGPDSAATAPNLCRWGNLHDFEVRRRLRI